jgi:hypothetical protein
MSKIGGCVMDERKLEFTIFCIESLAESLKMDAKKVYKLIKDTNVLDDYIIPCYEPLHSQSKHYIIEDLTEVLKERGALN